ncbi:MAG TPA: hypothetical protein VH352_05235 [Pseudonocardiaceae bacterium]|jgi:hypothetical protein|nr:hypothetical protein [Pseudonocardiaceae bacterium]
MVDRVSPPSQDAPAGRVLVVAGATPASQDRGRADFADPAGRGEIRNVTRPGT